MHCNQCLSFYLKRKLKLGWFTSFSSSVKPKSSVPYSWHNLAWLPRVEEGILLLNWPMGSHWFVNKAISKRQGSDVSQRNFSSFNSSQLYHNVDKMGTETGVRDDTRRIPLNLNVLWDTLLVHWGKEKHKVHPNPCILGLEFFNVGKSVNNKNYATTPSK